MEIVEVERKEEENIITMTQQQPPIEGKFKKRKEEPQKGE